MNITDLYNQQKRQKVKQLRQEKLDRRIVKAKNIRTKNIEII